MEVYFTSPILGRIYGTVTTQTENVYQFKGRNVLICLELCRNGSAWACQKEEWLHDSQIREIGSQIDVMEKWLSAQ